MFSCARTKTGINCCVGVSFSLYEILLNLGVVEVWVDFSFRALISIRGAANVWPPSRFATEKSVLLFCAATAAVLDAREERGKYRLQASQHKHTYCIYISKYVQHVGTVSLKMGFDFF